MEEEESDRFKQLTAREKDVLVQLGKGLSNRRSRGSYLYRSIQSKHVSSILAKLGLGHRTQAALLVNDLSRN